MESFDSWIKAIRTGNIKSAMSILKNNPDFLNKYKIVSDEVYSKYKTNAIIEAAYQGNREVVKWLIENQADVNAVSDKAWRPIHFAAQQGHVTTVNLLINAGADVGAETDDKETPIFLALHSYMRDTTKKLLHHGASIVGIDRHFLHSCIKKDVLDLYSLSDSDYGYLHTHSNVSSASAEASFSAKSDNPSRPQKLVRGILNTAQLSLLTNSSSATTKITSDQTNVLRKEPDVKIMKLTRPKLQTDYDNELKRRRNDLMRKMRRNHDLSQSCSQFITLIRNVAMSDSNNDRLRLIQDTKELLRDQSKPGTSAAMSLVSYSKVSDQLVMLLELCMCDSYVTEKFMSVAVEVMIGILQVNTRRNVEAMAVVDYCTRLFMKMYNLKIEQYNRQILRMILLVFQKVDDATLRNFSANQEVFMTNWVYFFENLCFPRCLEDSVRVLMAAYPHMVESINRRFSDITDIFMGWFISTDSKLETMASLREVSMLLHPCWVNDCRNLEKVLTNLLKDITAECQKLSLKHRLEKERGDIEEIKTRLKHLCWGFSAITTGITRLKDYHIPPDDQDVELTANIPDQLIVDLIHKFISSFISCVKQIDFTDNLLLQVNTILIHLMFLVRRSVYPIDSSQIVQTIVNYLIVTFNPTSFGRSLADSNALSYQNFTFYRSLLIIYDLCLDVLEHSGSGELPIVYQLFSPKTPLHSLLLYGCRAFDHEFNRCLMRLVDSIIQKPCVVAFYHVLLTDLQVCMNTLLKHLGLAPLNIVQQDIGKNRLYEPKQATMLARYNTDMIMYLHERLGEKTKLVPSIPTLLTKHLGACLHHKFVASFPELACFLYDSMLKIEFLTIDLIEDLLHYGRCFIQQDECGNYETRKVRFEYVDQLYWENIEYFCNNHTLKIQLLAAYLELFNATLIHDDQWLGKKIIEICHIFCTQIPTEMFTDILKEKLRVMVLHNCSSAVPEIQHASYAIYFHMRLYADAPHVNSAVLEAQVTELQTLMRTGKNFRFPHEFSKSVFSWIVTCTDTDSELDKRRLCTLLGHFREPTFPSTDICIIYELILNACCDCIQQKLKFDTKMESRTTLLTIENIVKFFISNGMTLRNFNDTRFQQLVSDFFSKEYTDQSKSINMLLLLLDMLEKLFYNAYQGCYKAFPGINKATEAFFVTNRRVCTDWFLKVRLMVMALAQYSNQWSMVVRQGDLLLAHYCEEGRPICQEVEDCIVLTAMALAKLHDWESLLGLHALALEMYRDKFLYLEFMADKVQGHLEQALRGFEEYIMHFYDPSSAGKGSIKLMQRQTYAQSSFVLVMEEIADCYTLLQDDASLSDWGIKMEVWKKTQMLEAKKCNTKWARLAVLARLSRWTISDDDADVSLEDVYTPNTEFSWRYRSFIDNCDNQIYNQMFEPTENALNSIKWDVAKIAAIQNICDFPNSIENPDLVQLTEKLHLLSACRDGSVDFAFEPLFQMSQSGLMPLSVINFYNALLTQHRNVVSDHFENREILLKWHRKRTNFNQCHQIIAKSYTAFLTRPHHSTRVNLVESLHPDIQIKLELEQAKLEWGTGSKLAGLKLLVTALNDSLFFETGDEKLTSLKCYHNTKSLLTLFKWLHNSETSAINAYFQDKQIAASLKLYIELAEVPWIQGLPILSPQQRIKHFQGNSSTTADTGQSLSSTYLKDICGQLLMLASRSKNQTPHNKGFITLAQWCLDRSKSIDINGLNDSNKLGELSAQLDTIQPQITQEVKEAVKTVFIRSFQTHKMDSEQAWFGVAYDDTVFIEQLTEQIQEATLKTSLSKECLSQICDVWKNTIRQHFSLHKASADAYFSFLKDSTIIDSSISYINQKRTANLRILSLLNKRSNDLRQNLIKKIHISQSSSWQTIEPQLFARLKHPDKYIRECIVELLKRLALSSRSSINEPIIYPTLVGCFNDSSNDHAANTIKQAYLEIKKSIEDANPQLVSHVEIFIKELRRITVLWDELWISSLGQCYDELHKKSQQFQHEIDHIDENYYEEDEEKQNVLLMVSYKATIQTAAYILERIHTITNREPPETPREKLFHEEFHEKIASVISELREPPSIRNFKQTWKRIKELQDEIISFVNSTTIMKQVKVKHGRHQYLSLKLSQISPDLFQLAKHQIPLPGGGSGRELISISEDIIIYPTKTKPKFLKLHTSAGNVCDYLYKGMEDLRLDERIMQVLDLINSMFLKINQKEHPTNCYQISTYPVTPIGPRAGLIEMIKDCTSLFSLYKHNQACNKAASNATAANGVKFDTSPLKVPYHLTNNNTILSDEYHHQTIRPVEIYWQKLQPKLDQLNRESSTSPNIEQQHFNRDKLPQSLLIEVFNELRTDTTKNLLSNELWCCSINPNNWWRSCTKFQRFSAIMSIIGHVIGLGDRHLDNLLVNLSDGRLVHIDYNICFDKGLSLKVPEKVPFRLTDIITDVFGPTGVNGIFKNTCHNVYKVIQETRDNILTLMDSFVLDPIIDWYSLSGIETGHFGSFEGGKYALCSSHTQLEKRLVEFNINLYNFCYSLLTSSKDIDDIRVFVATPFDSLTAQLTHQVKLQDESTKIREAMAERRELINYMVTDFDKQYQKELLDNYSFINDINEKQTNFEDDLSKRVTQLQSIVDGHTRTFKSLSNHEEFLQFKNWFSNLPKLITDFKDFIVKNCGLPLEQTDEISVELNLITMELVDFKHDLALIDRYRVLLREMPQDFFIHNRCNEALIFMNKIQHIGKSDMKYIPYIISQYQNNWSSSVDASSAQVHTIKLEQQNWLNIIDYVTQIKHDIDTHPQYCTYNQDQRNQEIAMDLDAIWSLICNESYHGINVFKSVLLEQYLSMAKVATDFDFRIVNKLPEKLQLKRDYNPNIRSYLTLTNIHEHFIKCYTNYCNVFGITMINNVETMGVFTSLTLLHKLCTNLNLMEKNFHEIIIPESVKIMKILPQNQQEIDLISQLNKINSQTDSVLLHFKTALTSETYDIKTYDNVHENIVKCIQDKMETMINLQNFPQEFGYEKQLRILIASFFNVIHQTYISIVEFIDYIMQHQIPSSWNYVDLLAQNSARISPIWTKSIMLMKDTLYIHMVRILCNYVANVHSLVTDITTTTTLTDCSNLYSDFCYYLELYLHFVNRHILQGIASACFTKLYCVFLEFNGWNIDQILNDNLVSNQCINTELLTSSVLTYRRTEYNNAFSFMSQLQHRFTQLKLLFGFNDITSPCHESKDDEFSTNISHEFLSRNSDFICSLLKLATNQVKVVSWSNKHLLLSNLDDKNLDNISIHSELRPLFDLNDELLQLPHKLTEYTKLRIIDRISNIVKVLVQSSDEENSQKTAILDTCRNNITQVNDYLINIDRFECFRTKNSDLGIKFDDEMINFLMETQDLFEQSNKIQNLIKPMDTRIVQLKSEFNILDSDNWICVLIENLEQFITESSLQISANNDQLIEFINQQLPIANDKITKTLLHHYQPLMIHLKSSIKSMKNCIIKIHGYENQEALEQRELIRQDYYLMTQLLEIVDTFNNKVDSIKALMSHENLEDNIPELQCVITTLSHTTIPNLFDLLQYITDKLHKPYTDEGSSCGIVASTSNNDFLDALCHDKISDPVIKTGAVAKAIDNWCLVEARINLTNKAFGGDYSDNDNSIKKYVNNLIKCARDPNNLSRMYEGWTAWV